MKILIFLISIMLTCHIYAMEETLKQSLTQLNQNLNMLARLLEMPKVKRPLPKIPKVEKPRPGEFLYHNPDANIFQRRVLQQVNNANCGYYALKDTLYTLRALEGDEQAKKQLPILLQNKTLYAEDHKAWSMAIAQKRAPEGSVTTDWLQGSELEWLYTYKTPNKPTTPLWTIDNIDWISTDKHYQGLALNPQGLTIVHNFRTLTNYQYGFLLNNAREYFKEGAIIAGRGHWIGVVVVKEGATFNYYVTDSLNQDRTKSDIVLTLKGFLEKDNLINIKITLSGIENYLDTISRLKPAALGAVVPDYAGSQDQAIYIVLREIDRIIQAAERENFFNAKEFSGYKQLLLVDLQDIISTGKISYEYKELVPSWLSKLGGD